MKRITGIYEKLGELNFFIPDPLPPVNPQLILDPEIMELYGKAMHSLGQLNEMAQRLPDLERFNKAYVVKEALLSSAIEGIHTTLLDVFTPPMPQEQRNKDTQLVFNYTKSLDAALEMILVQGMPITSRVILEAHEVLMSAGEGNRASPGRYRQQTVRVGELIPPPAPKVLALIGDLEKFINTDQTMPALLKAGLAHVQFETIHPFLDGNGRIGRLLIVLMLIDNKLLSAPIIYPSYYFKKHHMEYYRCLDRVRLEGDFEGWIRFYLEAIYQSASDAWRRAKDIETLALNIHHQLLNSKVGFKNNEQKNNLISILFQSPVINIREFSDKLQRSYNSTAKIISQLIDFGVLQEITEQKRNKLFKFKTYLDLLEKEY